MECENHPEEVAVENCVVCGAGVCEECLRPLDGEPYCITCAEEYSHDAGDGDGGADMDDDDKDLDDHDRF